MTEEKSDLEFEFGRPSVNVINSSQVDNSLTSGSCKCQKMREMTEEKGDLEFKLGRPSVNVKAIVPSFEERKISFKKRKSKLFTEEV